MVDAGVGRRVVVTGMGVVTPIGQTVPDFWEGLRQGRSGVFPIETFPQNEPHILKISQIPDFHLDVMIAGQVRGFEKMKRLRHFKRDKIILHADRYSLFAAVAADEAVKQSGLEVPFTNPHRACSIVGSALGGIMNYEIGYRYLYELKQTATHPLTLVRFIGSSAAAHIGIEFGVKGPTYGMTSACASAAHAIEVGRDYIRHGVVDIAIVGASDAPLTYGMMQAFEATGLLSPQGIYPFARKRNGTVLGEGAGVLVLESMRHARLRGAKVLAELCGVGMSTDSSDLMSPDVDGPCEAMRAALDDAQIAPSDIDYVNAHGIGTIANDRSETQAMRKVFGNHVANLAVSSTKSMYGHPLGASSSIGAVACIKAMSEGWVPPTMGLDEPDPECDLDHVANAGRDKQLTYTMANAFAYTGINASLVFGPPPA